MHRILQLCLVLSWGGSDKWNIDFVAFGLGSQLPFFGGLKQTGKKGKISVDEEENFNPKQEKENNPMNKFEPGVKIMRLLCFKLTGRRR